MVTLDPVSGGHHVDASLEDRLEDRLEEVHVRSAAVEIHAVGLGRRDVLDLTGGGNPQRVNADYLVGVDPILSSE